MRAASRRRCLEPCGTRRAARRDRAERSRAGGRSGIAVDVAATQLLVDGTYLLASENRTPSRRRACRGDRCVGRRLPDRLDRGRSRRRRRGRLAARDGPAGGPDPVLGDDLFVTAPRAEAGIREGIANAVLVKPNQVAHSAMPAALSDRRGSRVRHGLSARRVRPRTAGSPISRSAGDRPAQGGLDQRSERTANGTASANRVRARRCDSPAGAQFLFAAQTKTSTRVAESN